MVWNRTLAWRQARYRAEQAPTSYAQASAYLTAMKATEELGWLGEVSSVPLQQALRHQQAVPVASSAKPLRCPRYKSRGGRQCAEYTRSGFRYRDGQLFLAKMSTPLAFAWSWPDVDPASVDPTTVTAVSGTHAAAGMCPTRGGGARARAASPGGAIVKGWTRAWTSRSTSDGQKIHNPRSLARRERSLARYQRRMARCQQGSANQARARAKVARALLERASRMDFLHRTSAPALVRDHDVIVIEDLNVRGMVRGNRPLAKAISDCGWGSFRRLLEYRGGPGPAAA